MCVSSKWVVLWSLWACGLVRQPTEPVRVRGGWLRGSVARDGSHHKYLNVPYGTTSYETRFQAPGPAPSWEGIFEAINENVQCPQRYGPKIYFGHPDCLTLNVYVPTHDSTEKPLPVMVFFHGGAYYSGSATHAMYSPDYLVSKGVILVTANYRLNIQGFLCLGIKEAPGNAGMKDQVAALRWVRDNIRAFGGDPNSVTIFGESAGSASVSYHLLSPMSKGLFHKAILQSGSSLASWAFQIKPIEMASLMAKVMGYETKDPHELYKIFMEKDDPELVITRVPRKEGHVIISEIIFVPCAESPVEGVEPFLTDTPYNLFSRGEYNKVPIITGTNSEEGFFIAAMENATVLNKIKMDKCLPRGLRFPNDEEREAVISKLKTLYLADDEDPSENLLKLSQYHADPFLNYPTLAEADLMLRTNKHPIYSYVFNYDGWRNLAKLSSGRPYSSAPGATHADELFYLFKVFSLPSFFETTMINVMTTLWTNFAKHGDPTPEVSPLIPVRWEPVNRTSPRSLLIDKQLGSVPLWYKDTFTFWHQVYTKYGWNY